MLCAFHLAPASRKDVNRSREPAHVASPPLQEKLASDIIIVNLGSGDVPTICGNDEFSISHSRQGQGGFRYSLSVERGTIRHGGTNHAEKSITSLDSG